MFFAKVICSIAMLTLRSRAAQAQTVGHVTGVGGIFAVAISPRLHPRP